MAGGSTTMACGPSSSLSVEDEGELDDHDRGIDEAAERASAALADVFGPHAKLVVQSIDHTASQNKNKKRKRREVKSVLHRSDRHADDPPGEEEASASPPLLFRASSTFKLLGFMVELASATGSGSKEEVVERCLELSLRSDIPFIDPRKKAPTARGGRRASSSSSFALTPHETELKAIIDELRELCRHFSRRLKFSIKHPSVAAAANEGGGVEVEEEEGTGTVEDRYACRVYQKDEWYVVSRSVFVLETYGSSPRQVLLRALVQLREQFQREMSSPEKWRECVQEAAMLLQSRGKKMIGVRLVQEGKSGGVGSSEEVLMDGQEEEEDAEGRGKKKSEDERTGSLAVCFPDGEGGGGGGGSEVQRDALTEVVEEAGVGETTTYIKRIKKEEEEVELAFSGEEGGGGGASTVKKEEEEEEPLEDIVSSSMALPPIGLCTYCGTLTIEDQFGNTFTSTARRQRSPLLAYQHACQQAMWAEQSQFLPSACLLDDFAPSLAGSGGGGGTLFCVPSSPPPPPPLLTRLRWQVALLSQSIAQELGLSRAEAIVCVEIKGAKEISEGSSGSGNRALQEFPSSSSASHPRTGDMDDDEDFGGGVGGHLKKKEKGDEVFFVVSVTAMEGTATLSMTSGTGRYRLLLQGYVTALEYLFDAYPDASRVILQHRLHCHRNLALFPSVGLLREAVQQHDHYSLLSHHKGKWNCVAVLGTLTSALMGTNFHTAYLPPPTTHGAKTDWVATLTVATGEQSAELLLQKSAKTKAEALKRACVEALRENFPYQHAEVIRVHPDVDVSHDTLAKSSKYRSLPREKRVEHIQSLFAMVCAFAEEDLGWFQPRIRFRNTSAELGFPQWVAEFEVTVEEEQERRTVAVSPPHLQSRMAKRVLLWRLAEQYFPKELEYYKALKRGDGVNPVSVAEESGGGGSGGSSRFLYYKPHSGIAFVDQLFDLMAQQHTSLLPFSWTLRGAVVSPHHHHHSSSSSSSMDDDDPSYWGEGETPDRLLQPLRLQYSSTVLGNHGDLIIAEYKGKRIYAPSFSTSSLPNEAGGEEEEGSDIRRQESPVEVLLTALKTASHHLCRAESEAIWTEFETHEPPPVPSTRELCTYLFYALWGNQPYVTQGVVSSNTAGGASPSDGREEEEEEEEVGVGVDSGSGSRRRSTAAAASLSPSHAASAYQPVVEVHAMKVADQWVGTLTLPLLGSLPVARAYGSTKKKCVKDALTLGARICFPQILQYWMKNVPTASELAKEILTEPIAAVLPDALQKDVHRQLQQQESRKGSGGHPFSLLRQQVFQEYKGARTIRVERSRAAGSEWQCRLYLQWKKVAVEKGSAQLVGYGAGDEPEKVLYDAACAALENLYEIQFSETVKKTTTSAGGGGGRRRRSFPPV